MPEILTLESLENDLWLRLNDLDHGNYSQTEIDACINVGYRESQIATKSNSKVVQISTQGNVNQYTCPGVFEIIGVSNGTSDLDKIRLSDVSLDSPSWAATGSSARSGWIPLSGDSFLITPKPTGAQVLYILGYAVSDLLANPGDIANALPDGLGKPLILDRAEAEARRMRPTHAGNLQLYTDLMTKWGGWAQMARGADKGE